MNMCVVDWVLISEILSHLALIIGSLAALVGVYNWKVQWIFKQQAEVAREVLLKCLLFRELIYYLRNPATFEYEKNEVINHYNISESEYKNEHKLLYKIHKNIDVINDFMKIEYEYVVLFGDNESRLFKDVNNIVRKIINAARNLNVLGDQLRYTDDIEERANIRNDIVSNRGILFSVPSHDDEINSEINKIVDQFSVKYKSLTKVSLLSKFFMRF